MYRWEIWYAGPRTRWQGKPHADEIIARGEAPWQWLARAGLWAVFRQLDPAVCGWSFRGKDGIRIEVYDPPSPEPRVPA